MPAYLIVNYDVENPDLYAEYGAVAGAALNVGTDCKVIAFDPKSDAAPIDIDPI